ncbi:hypothetical protein C9I94_19730 [Photobacterium swingsii]|uniref:MSHA biogenesis protein MshF n=1 Tax=Photobacterium swingsii TaxID=680026 RepID=A0A2T3P2I4_9GAMM|nr:hypothetical protein C9I94_19730 [Photobacterium swingsii]
MLPEAFNLRQAGRYKFFIWFGLILTLIFVLQSEWQKVNEKAEDVALKLTINSLYEGASSLRQSWELNNRPEYLEVDGVNLHFTTLGWPLIEKNNNLDCYQLWRILTPANISAPYVSLLYTKEAKSVTYESCIYEISTGKWLELFYENETIKFNDFMARKES